MNNKSIFKLLIISYINSHPVESNDDISLDDLLKEYCNEYDISYEFLNKYLTDKKYLEIPNNIEVFSEEYFSLLIEKDSLNPYNIVSYLYYLIDKLNEDLYMYRDFVETDTASLNIRSKENNYPELNSDIKYYSKRISETEIMINNYKLLISQIELCMTTRKF